MIQTLPLHKNSQLFLFLLVLRTVVGLSKESEATTGGGEQEKEREGAEHHSWN